MAATPGPERPPERGAGPERPPLDILVVTGGFPLLSQSFIERKVLALAARGHRVTVLATGPGDHRLDPEVVASLGDRLRVEPAPGGPRPWRAARSAVAVLTGLARHRRFVVGLWRALRAARGTEPERPPERRTRPRLWRGLALGVPLAGRQPDVVHVEWATKAVPRMEALSLVPSRTVVSCRGSDVRVMAAADDRFAADLRRLFARVDAVHCVSAAVADAATTYGLDPAKAFVNHPGVDPGFFCPRPAAASPPWPVRILSVGRVHWVKGYEHGLEAIRLLVDRGCDVRYTIVGDGDGAAAGAVRFAIHDLGLSDRVELTGSRLPAEVRDLLARSHVFLLPSLSEGLSNAVLEAMAMELPVVVTDVGGMSEAVRDGAEGYLVPARDPAAMADRLQRLAVDGALRAELGAQGRRRVCESFAIDRQVDRFVDQYRKLLDGGGRQ